MSRHKSEKSANQMKALCQFVKVLPTGLHVTFGSGCIVWQVESQPSAHLITTTQVVTKNDLLGDSSIFVLFQDGQRFELKLKSRDEVDLPDPKTGRVLRNIGGNEIQVSFLRIPVDMFDLRIWPVRKLFPMGKRALYCIYPSDEDLETSISNKNITCVITEISKDRRGFYITEPSYLSFGEDTSEFALLSASDPDCAFPPKSFKDFPKEVKPKGAPLLDAKGRLVGMLAVASSGERKIYPVFLPTLTGESHVGSLGNEKISNADMTPTQNTIFRPGTDEEEQHNDHSPKIPPSKESINEDKGAQISTTDRQGSASPPSSPLHESSPEANLGNGAAQKQHKDQQHNESGSQSHRLQNEEECSSDEIENYNSAEEEHGQPQDDPRSSSLREDGKESCSKETVSNYFSDMKLSKASEGKDSVQVSNRESSLLFNNNYNAINNVIFTLLQEEDSIDSDLERDSAATLEEHDQEVENAGHGDANNEVSLREEPDGGCREGDPMVNSYLNENESHDRTRILATQNSHHDQLSDLYQLLDDEGNSPYPKIVADPTSPEHKPTLRERQSNSQHRMDRIAPMRPDEVSKGKEHVNAGRNTLNSFSTSSSGSYVEKLIVRKELIMDVLSLYLDRSIYPKFRGAPLFAQRWEHLADQCKVDVKVKKQCGSFAHLSPSEAMFEYLCQSGKSVTVGILKQYLLEISRKDVHDELANNQDLLDDANVNDLCDKHPETLWNVCLNLDDMRSVSHWYHLGLKIGINGERLKSFKDPSEFSPSQAILEKIETLRPQLPLTEMQMVLKELEKWIPGIGNVLNDLLGFFWLITFG
ncbi:hypothetical protein AWC38_SpisGene19292 [Stylophora pistillata]|uniref:Death domain-containing protein n=1 Tax=Stylophora pistillata TaxID=50429 RepID=A0A2B4RGZ7_STYPI|nr:hypothetical protein AWC38_SpisGene19292 [Stylophora pistillata]